MSLLELENRELRSELTEGILLAATAGVPFGAGIFDGCACAGACGA